MALKVYAFPYSTCSKRVATVLYEKKIPHELILVDLSKGEHKAPSYLEKQPFGQVPYIDDDGLILYESRAICRYLEEKYGQGQGQRLIPTDPKKKALFEQAASVEMANFDPYAGRAAYEAVIKKRLGQETDQAAHDQAIATLNVKLDVYDKILEKQKFLAGDEMTLADLSHLPYGSVLASGGNHIMTDPKRPNVARWWTTLTSLPSWQTVQVEVPTGVVNF
ncbi:hypothetical protein D9758_016954 [Tetrapyrgos nigripes]|uniref:glutathione transferase n=1 Tax=Tetrapyrgos nigripes TaxID=182062 RepID=A0A8H5C1E3_9AGAR|nr:hypothetical protein D9758_016954 [Tetrapyrgos nigripes]